MRRGQETRKTQEKGKRRELFSEFFCVFINYKKLKHVEL